MYRPMGISRQVKVEAKCPPILRRYCRALNRLPCSLMCNGRAVPEIFDHGDLNFVRGRLSTIADMHGPGRITPQKLKNHLYKLGLDPGFPPVEPSVIIVFALVVIRE